MQLDKNFMNNSIIGFWIYSILVAITILNHTISIFNILFSFLYVIVCFYYAIKVINFKAIKYILLFSVFYIVEVILSPVIPGTTTTKWGMLNWELKVMLTFFPSFYFSRRGIISKMTIVRLSVLLFAVAIISYYLNIKIVLLNAITDEGGITNNVGYIFVGILPILFLNVRKCIVLILISYIFILISLKRGAILCGIITIPFFIYLIRSNYKINKSLISYIILLGCIVLSYSVHKTYQENEYVAKRIDSTSRGNMSGRDAIADNIWKEFSKFNSSDIISGKGINYSMKIAGNYAHNDWLELLTSTGVLGCFFYLLMFYGMIRYCKIFCKGENRYIGYMIIIIAIIKSFISMNYFSIDSIPLYCGLGLICDKSKKK